MKRFGLLLLLASGLLAAPAGVHTVYILPMAGGLDQYLAEWLTRANVVQIVTDPKAADAVMTDSLGEAFEQKMAQIRPAPPPDKDAKPAAETNTVHPYKSGFAKGTLFLVDAKTRAVVWSDYEKPPNSSTSANLNREAERVAKKLAGPPAK
jgi:hypothetical protein